MRYLNLGCGCRFHSGWTNVDFYAVNDEVIAWNLASGIPFDNAEFDVVYHSHLLEHFPKSTAELFIKECYRVLRPQGVLRIVVPDLEQIAQNYITALEHVSSGSPEWAMKYEWAVLELYDQTVRNEAGGAIAQYLKSNRFDTKFVLSRWGLAAKNLISSEPGKNISLHTVSPWGDRLKQVLKPIYRFLRYSNYRKEIILKQLLDEEYTALQIGRFRLSGEVHQWMYDHYSLRLLLETCGFEDVVQRTATESYIPDWGSFHLDTELDGAIARPDSLFIEAVKPAA